jgi:hypothetical protein
MALVTAITRVNDLPQTGGQSSFVSLSLRTIPIMHCRAKEGLPQAPGYWVYLTESCVASQ